LVIIPLVVRLWVVVQGVSEWEIELRQRVPLRLDALALGVISVWAWRHWSQMRDTWSRRAGIIGIGLAGLSIGMFVVYAPNLDSAVLPQLVLLPVTSVAIALLMPALAQWQVAHIRPWHRAVQFVAHISYPLYLLHLPWRLTVEGMAGRIGVHWLADTAITIVYVVGAGWLAWQWHRLLEQPLMQLRWPDLRN